MSEITIEDMNDLGLEASDYIDAKTGEITENCYPIPAEWLEESKKQSIKEKKKQEFCKNRRIGNEAVSLFGCGDWFYFLHYDNLIKELNNDYALAFRFLFLCTHADYNGVLKIGKDNMNSTDIFITLKLSYPIFLNVTENLLKHKLLLEDKNGFKVNENYCLRGYLAKSFKQNSCRAFDSGIKSVYAQSKPVEHKTIGKIIWLLPFIHTEYNILCHNPDCKRFEDIQRLTLKEIGGILEGNVKNRNYNKVIKKLLNVKVNDRFLFDTCGDKNKCVVVNPTVFYKGKNPIAVKWLADFFRLTQKTHKETKKNKV